jgi:hypothetical protein
VIDHIQFFQVWTIRRPDFIVQALIQGRFALLVEGNPTVSIAPTNLLLQTKSPEDNYAIHM